MLHGLGAQSNTCLANSFAEPAYAGKQLQSRAGLADRVTVALNKHQIPTAKGVIGTEAWVEPPAAGNSCASGIAASCSITSADGAEAVRSMIRAARRLRSIQYFSGCQASK